MKKNIYNAHIYKRKLILDKFNDLKIDEVILDYLEEIDIDIKTTNISHLIQMIKKVLFDYYMYGKEVTKKIIEDNKNYLFNTYTNGDEIKENIQELINNQDINKTIVSMTDEVSNKLNCYFSLGLKNYSYVV